MENTARLYVKNWQKFQHYKFRRPPWIRLYVELLDDFAFNSLPLACRALAFQFWLLASESKDGSIPADSNELAWRLHCASTEVDDAITLLIEKGFLSTASNVLAPRYQLATTETETETEKSQNQKDGSYGQSVLNEENYKKNTDVEAEKGAREPEKPCSAKDLNRSAGAKIDPELQQVRLDKVMKTLANARQLADQRKAETG